MDQLLNCIERSTAEVIAWMSFYYSPLVVWIILTSLAGAEWSSARVIWLVGTELQLPSVFFFYITRREKSVRQAGELPPPSSNVEMRVTKRAREREKHNFALTRLSADVGWLVGWCEAAFIFCRNPAAHAASFKTYFAKQILLFFSRARRGRRWQGFTSPAFQLANNWIIYAETFRMPKTCAPKLEHINLLLMWCLESNFSLDISGNLFRRKPLLLLRPIQFWCQGQAVISKWPSLSYRRCHFELGGNSLLRRSIFPFLLPSNWIAKRHGRGTLW